MEGAGTAQLGGLGRLGRRPRLGVRKFASCDGCQLTLLDLEDELLLIADAVDIVDFAEASSTRRDDRFDLLLVEGSVSAPEQADEIVELRSRADVLVTIGACATAGGIQALRNWVDPESFREEVHTVVYPEPDFVESLATSTPIADHVRVDYELRGCPIDPGQLREFLAAVLVGRRPQWREESVCVECKWRGTVCIAVAGDTACLGPVTQAGCGAICPAYDRGCYGCFGPKEGANTASLVRWLRAEGHDEAEIARLFAGFTAWAEPFRSTVGELMEADDDAR